MTKRPGWDEYFLNIAQVVATRSSCLRRQVGAVIVRNKDIISTGYNGAPANQKSSLDIGWCYRDKNNIESYFNEFKEVNISDFFFGTQILIRARK